MKKVYVAGSYSANNVLAVLRNIGIGEDVCAELFLRGYAPFCPWHDKDFIIKRPYSKFTVDMFYNYSLEWLKVSDVVLVLGGWENSEGTKKEIEVAEEIGIPIYYNVHDLYAKESHD